MSAIHSIKAHGRTVTFVHSHQAELARALTNPALLSNSQFSQLVMDAEESRRTIGPAIQSAEGEWSTVSEFIFRAGVALNMSSAQLGEMLHQHHKLSTREAPKEKPVVLVEGIAEEKAVTAATGLKTTVVLP